MIIQRSEARELCSKSEWKLIESSFSPAIVELSPSDLKSRINRVRKLYRKCTDVVSGQHSDPRKGTTLRKRELFAEAIGQFETILKLIDNEYGFEPLATTNIRSKTEKIQSLNMDALRDRAGHEFANRKSEILSLKAPVMKSKKALKKPDTISRTASRSRPARNSAKV